MGNKKRIADEFDKAGFSERLKKQRALSGYTLQELGEIAGVSRSMIGIYENGESVPMADGLFKIARALRCTPDYLLGFTADEPDGEFDIYKRTGFTADELLALQSIKNKKFMSVVMWAAKDD